MLNDFLNYLKYEKRHSAKSIVSYRTDLEQFSNFLSAEYPDIFLEKASHNQIRSWIIQLSVQDIQASSLKRKVSALKSFYKFLIKQNIIEVNPAAKIITPKLKERLPKYIEQKRLNEVIDNKSTTAKPDEELPFADTYEGKQERLIVDMLYQTGMRRQELMDLKWEVVDFALKQMKITGKGNKQRLMPCSDNLLEQLREHRQAQQNNVEHITDSFIFLTKKGEQLYPNYVYRLVKKKLKDVAAEKKSPHVLRHSFATHISNNGAKLTEIKELLGHASLASTQIYTHNTIEQLKKTYKNAHPKA
jgi:integrase/recombinase XerC